MATLFISDVHLSSERPEKLPLFRRLIEGPAREAEALYILGDLFEIWLGDDDTTPPYPEVLSLLAGLSESGTPLYVMRGNRDVLLANEFAEAGEGMYSAALVELGLILFLITFVVLSLSKILLLRLGRDEGAQT